LRIAPDARAGGMGDMGVATNPDANSLFTNIGKVVFNEKKSGVAINYIPFLRELNLNDVYIMSASGYYKLDDNQAITAGLRYYSHGTAQFTDDVGNNLTTFKPSDFAFEAGYSRRLSKKSGIGVSLRYINSKLTDGSGDYKSGNTVSADIGFFTDNKNAAGQGWNYGIAVSNLGGKIGYTNSSQQKDYIPANLGMGIAYTAVFKDANKLSFGLELNRLLVPTPPDETNAAAVADYRTQSVVSSWFKSLGDAPGGFSEELKELQIGLGGEYTYDNHFVLRTGYFYENKTKGNRNYFTVGAGFIYKSSHLDFSYLVPNKSGSQALSNTIRLALIFDLKQ
ncbi:MAG: type IX secretion system outer membrane channel protein PorV, partial [Sediminibacterium sp.]